MTVVSLKISCAVLTLLEMVRDEKHGCGETREVRGRGKVALLGQLREGREHEHRTP